MRVRVKTLYEKSPFRYNIGVQANIAERKGDFMANKANDMAHTKWMCKYHIVFTPKYRRKIIYNQYKEDLRDIIKQLCSYKGVTIIEGHLMPDHIHMLVSIPPKISVSSFMGYLNGKSALMMFDKHANLKYKFGSAVPVSEPSKTETPEALVTRAIVGFYHPSKSTPKLHLTTALTTDSEISRNRKSKYPGVAQLVARVVWDHQAAGSNPVTRTKSL